MDVDLTSEALKSIVPTFSVVPVVNPASSTSAINNTVNKTTTIAAAAPEVTLVVKNHHQTTPVNHRPDGIMNGVGIMNHHRHQQQKPVMAVNAAIVPKQQNNSNTKNTSSPRPTMGAAASSINNNTNNNNYFPKNGSVGMGAKHRQQSSPNHHPPVLNKNQSNPPFNAPQHPQSILKRSVSMVNIGITNVNGGAGHHQKSPPNPGGINTSLSSVLKQPTSTPIGNNNTKSSISTTMPVVNQHQQQQTLNRPFQSLQQKQSPHGMQGMGNQNQPPQPPQIVNCVNNISKPEMMVHLQKTAVGAGMCIGNHLNSNNTGDGLNKRPRCD